MTVFDTVRSTNFKNHHIKQIFLFEKKDSYMQESKILNSFLDYKYSFFIA